MHVHPPASLQALQAVFTAKTCGVFRQGLSTQQNGGALVGHKSQRDKTRVSCQIRQALRSIAEVYFRAPKVYTAARAMGREPCRIQKLWNCSICFSFPPLPFFFFSFFSSFLLQEIQYSLFLGNRSSSSYTGTITLLCYFILGIPTRTWWLAVAGL